MLKFNIDHIGVMGTGLKENNAKAKTIIETRVVNRIKAYKKLKVPK
jgi:hypothetical protein